MHQTLETKIAPRQEGSTRDIDAYKWESMTGRTEAAAGAGMGIVRLTGAEGLAAKYVIA